MTIKSKLADHSLTHLSPTTLILFQLYLVLNFSTCLAANLLKPMQENTSFENTSTNLLHQNHQECYKKNKPPPLEYVTFETSDSSQLKLPYKVSEGKLVSGGDIFLGEEADIKSFYLNKRIKPWPNGEIKYYFAEGISQIGKDSFRLASKQWADKTNGLLKFIEIEQQLEGGNYLEIKKGSQEDACFSDLGFQEDSVNYITFSKDGSCQTQSIVHEIGHTLGLLHEHQRPDRNKHIKILWCNINPIYYYAFEKLKVSSQTAFTKNYDYKSVMHYPKNAFTINNKNTIKAKLQNIIQETQEISTYDIETISNLYGEK